MKHLSKILTLAFLFATGISYADFCCENSDPCSVDCCNICDWKFHVDAGVVVSKFGIEEDAGEINNNSGGSSPSDPYLDIEYHFCPDWTVGYRIGGAIEAPCQSVGIKGKYTWFCTSDSITIEAPDGSRVVDPEIGNDFSDLTKAKAEWTYQQYEAVGTYHCCFCGIGWVPFAGFRGLQIDQSIKENNSDRTGVNYATLANGGDTSTSKIDLSALGFIAGVELNKQCCDWLNLFGRIGFSYLCTTLKRKTVTVSTGSGASDNDNRIFEYKGRCDNPNDEHTNFEGSIGLSINRCICNRMVNFAVAYEYHSYEFISNFDDMCLSNIIVSMGVNF